MTTIVTLKAIVLWFAILILAILNGTLREKILIPHLGSVPAFIAFAAAPWYGALTSRQWLLLGLFWLLLTVVFEFSFGLFAQHKTWAELFDAYTFRGGNIWPIVLIITFISPWLAAKCRGLI